MTRSRAPISKVNFPEDMAYDPQVEAMHYMVDLEHELTGPERMVGPIAFTVSDAETAASNLVLAVYSSDTNLVPAGNLALSGAGSNRTITITPATNRSGTTSSSPAGEKSAATFTQRLTAASSSGSYTPSQ